MKKRVITGAVLTILVVSVIFLNIPIFDTLVVFLLSIVGMYEYNKAFKSAGYNLVPLIGYLSCFGVFLIGLNIDYSKILTIICFGFPIIVILSFIYAVLTKLKTNIVDVALSVFSVIYIPVMFSFLKLILNLENGRLYIWFVIFGAFACDTLAYLIGSKFGKNKLCPDVSPNKTIEGSIAGIIGVILSYIIIYMIAKYCLNISLNIWLVMIMAIATGIVGQFGDLAESALKRFCKIKDSGKIIPGHGGVLDRFDSIMFIAPVVYMILKVYMQIF